MVNFNTLISVDVGYFNGKLYAVSIRPGGSRIISAIGANQPGGVNTNKTFVIVFSSQQEENIY